MLALKILLSVLFYTIVIFIISPVVDHIFAPLDTEESESEILIEIVSQILAIAIFWYLISEYIVKAFNTYLGVRGHPIVDKTKEIIGAVVMVGLQTHLLSKLNYITTFINTKYLEEIEFYLKFGFICVI